MFPAIVAEKLAEEKVKANMYKSKINKYPLFFVGFLKKCPFKKMLTISFEIKTLSFLFRATNTCSFAKLVLANNLNYTSFRMGENSFISLSFISFHYFINFLFALNSGFSLIIPIDYGISVVACSFFRIHSGFY